MRVDGVCGVLTVGYVTEELQQQEGHNRMIEAKVRELVGTVQTLTSSEVPIGLTSNSVQKHVRLRGLRLTVVPVNRTAVRRVCHKALKTPESSYSEEF